MPGSKARRVVLDCLVSSLRAVPLFVCASIDCRLRRAARRTALDCTAPEGSLRRYFDIDYVAWRDLTKRTIEHYHASIKSLEKFCDYVVMLDDLTDDLVNSFLLDKQDRGNKPRTVASARTDIMALWRSAVQDGKIDALPRRVRRIKVPREIITAWSLDEMTALVRAAESIESYSTFGTVTIHRGKLLKAYILVGWDTGLRRGDMLRLKRSDIQDDGRIDLTQTKTEQLGHSLLGPRSIRQIRQHHGGRCNSPAAKSRRELDDHRPGRHQLE